MPGYDAFIVRAYEGKWRHLVHPVFERDRWIVAWETDAKKLASTNGAAGVLDVAVCADDAGSLACRGIRTYANVNAAIRAALRLYNGVAPETPAASLADTEPEPAPDSPDAPPEPSPASSSAPATHCSCIGICTCGAWPYP